MGATQRRLGELLVSAGILEGDALAKGLELQREHGGHLVDVLIRNRLIEERAALRYVAESSGARYITTDKLRQAKLEPDLLDKVPARHAEKLGVLPLSFVPATGTLTLAVAELDSGLVEQVRLAAGVRNVVPIIASRPGLQAAIKRFYYGDTYAFAELDQPELRAVVRPEPPGKVLAREDSKVARRPAKEDEGGGTEVFGHAQEPDRAQAEKSGRPDGELEQLRRENRLLKLAGELHRHVARERDVTAILQRVLAFAFDNLPADDGVLLEVDGESGELRPIGVRTRSTASGELVISETLVREVIETRQGVLTGDAMADARFSRAQSVVSAGLRSAMGVPLLVNEQVRGVLVLDTRGRIDVFSDQHLQMLMAIAAQASVSLENAELTRRIAAESATRAHLARFLSPSLVELAASGQLSLAEDGEVQQATVLFADIRGFTSLSESMPPGEVVSMLNEHFEHLVDVVFAHGGVLDKFSGDALMALWGVPLKREDDAAHALRAALEMMERLDRLNELRIREGKTPLQMGIGINTGPVVFGAMGSTRRLEFTAIGDAVNTAARLSDLAAPMQIVAAQATLDAAQASLFEVEPLGELPLAGKAREIRAYAVRGETTGES